MRTEKMKITKVVTENYKRLNTGLNFFTFNDDMILCDNIYMVEDEDNVHKFGAAFSAAFVLTNGDYMIATDRFFKQVPKVVQNFIVQHEIGHIKCNHMIETNPTKYVTQRAFGKKDLMEFEADMYACNKIGKRNSIMALTYLYRNTDLSLLSKMEILRRLKNINESSI